MSSSHRNHTLDNQIETAIRSNPYLNGRKLRYEMADGRVVLHGEVASYFQKQMVQESLRNIPGVGSIDNQLHVAWPSTSQV